MVDASGLDATLAHPLVGDMAREQIAAATVVAVTKLDLLPEAAHAPIFAKLASLARTRLIVAADHGVVAPELVFGTVAAPARGDELRLRPWQIPRRLNLRSVCVRLDGPVRKAALKAFLKSLPGTVLRAKGIVQLDDDSGLYSCHAVGGRVALSRIEDEQALADESPVLVLHRRLRRAGGARACRRRPAGLHGSSAPIKVRNHFTKFRGLPDQNAATMSKS